ncbi:MAG TPA: helix-turn-helix domain-containing protein [Candidatus Binatia bacterium]|jgi:transcriptional regulator with XRE-family HTH domain
MDKQFSSRLAETIRTLGMGPTEFARRARIPQGTISKCLSGHVPTARILLRIAKFTGKSVDWLLLGAGQGKGDAGYVAERAARYGRAGVAGKTRAAEQVWVEKLLKVLRSNNRRKTQTIKDLLDVLARDA